MKYLGFRAGANNHTGRRRCRRPEVQRAQRRAVIRVAELPDEAVNEVVEKEQSIKK